LTVPHIPPPCLYMHLVTGGHAPKGQKMDIENLIKQLKQSPAKAALVDVPDLLEILEALRDVR
jgi:hypothetical protein